MKGTKEQRDRNIIFGADAKKVEKCEGVLLGAMLRSPSEIIKYIEQFPEKALQNSQVLFHKQSVATEVVTWGQVVTEILEQTKSGNFTPYQVAQKLDIATSNILHYASEDFVELQFALDVWNGEYKLWAEQTALQSAFFAADRGFDAIRETLESVREKLGTNYVIERKTSVEEFEQWAIEKESGIVREIITRTNMPSVNRIIGGYEQGYLHVVAARPGMGKTHFAVNCMDAFESFGAKGNFYSVEMPGRDVYKRLMSSRFGVDPRADWRNMTESERQLMKDAIRGTKELNVNIVDHLSRIGDLEAHLIASHYKGQLDYAIFDYLQLIEGIDHNSREVVVSNISRRLALLAKKLNIPIIALAQLSRAVETRGGAKRPMLSDLRESGAIEQDAATVTFLHRPEYYNVMEFEDGATTKGAAEIIVAKNRNGDIDDALVKFSGVCGFYENTEQYFPTTEPPQSAKIEPTNFRNDTHVPF